MMQPRQPLKSILRLLFAKSDSNFDNYLDIHEFRRFDQSLGHDDSDEVTQKFFALADTNHDGLIDFRELVGKYHKDMNGVHPDKRQQALEMLKNTLRIAFPDLSHPLAYAGRGDYQVQLSIKCTNLIQMNEWMSMPNPLVGLYWEDPTIEGRYRLLSQTELIINEEHPEFENKLYIDLVPNSTQRLLFRVFDVDVNTNDRTITENDFMGASVVILDFLINSPNPLAFQLTNNDMKPRNKKLSSYGAKLVIKADRLEEYLPDSKYFEGRPKCRIRQQVIETDAEGAEPEEYDEEKEKQLAAELGLAADGGNEYDDTFGDPTEASGYFEAYIPPLEPISNQLTEHKRSPNDELGLSSGRIVSAYDQKNGSDRRYNEIDEVKDVLQVSIRCEDLPLAVSGRLPLPLVGLYVRHPTTEELVCLGVTEKRAHVSPIYSRVFRFTKKDVALYQNSTLRVNIYDGTTGRLSDDTRLGSTSLKMSTLFNLERFQDSEHELFPGSAAYTSTNYSSVVFSTDRCGRETPLKRTRQMMLYGRTFKLITIKKPKKNRKSRRNNKTKVKLRWIDLFIREGPDGFPHLFWCARGQRTEREEYSIPTADIGAIVLGRQAPAFDRLDRNDARGGCCFSILAGRDSAKDKHGRTKELHLIASSQTARDTWATGFHLLSQAAGANVLFHENPIIDDDDQDNQSIGSTWGQEKLGSYELVRKRNQDSATNSDAESLYKSQNESHLKKRAEREPAKSSAASLDDTSDDFDDSSLADRLARAAGVAKDSDDDGWTTVTETATEATYSDDVKGSQQLPPWPDEDPEETYALDQARNIMIGGDVFFHHVSGQKASSKRVFFEPSVIPGISPGYLKWSSSSDTGELPLVGVNAIYLGRQQGVFAIGNPYPADDRLSFSLVCQDGTSLDLETISPNQRVAWVMGLLGMFKRAGLKIAEYPFPADEDDDEDDEFDDEY